MTRIGLIGCGMWGRNLARNLAALGALAAVADQHADRADAFAAEFGTDSRSVEDLLTGDGIDGVVIASAAPTHADLACRALAHGRHTYVEKPFAMTLHEAETMAAAASAHSRQLMVGHLIRHHDAFCELQEQIVAGVIGDVRHVTANRLAMGRIRNTESVIHDLCPHDLSLILAIMGEAPTDLSCSGASHMTAGMPDMVSTFLRFDSGRSASMNTSWLCPYKEHRLTVTGTTGSIVFDDTRPWDEKLTLYRDAIEADGHIFTINRSKPLHLPVAEAEPLKQEMQAFVTCCETGEPALTGIEDALAVQKVLQRMIECYTEFGTAPSQDAAVRQGA